ncbi:MAG: DUF896 domain-containing protein [Oscillospiraceae bacterium]|nr:DUF896 domain-containing protein [Oscillospiraceae bacterium]
MTDLQIARINELAKKSRLPQGLTADEKEEQAALRKAYIAAMRGSLENELSRVRIVTRDGSVVPLEKKHE